MRRVALALAVVAAVALAADWAVAGQSSHRGPKASVTLVGHQGHHGHHGPSHRGSYHGRHHRPPHHSYHHGPRVYVRPPSYYHPPVYRYRSYYPYYGCPSYYPYGGFYYRGSGIGFSIGF